MVKTVYRVNGEGAFNAAALTRMAEWALAHGRSLDVETITIWQPDPVEHELVRVVEELRRALPLTREDTTVVWPSVHDNPAALTAYLAEAHRDLLEAERDIAGLRRLLWITHAHSPTATHHLYGDDGEMQCSLCGIDFHRASVAVMQDRLEE